MYTAGAIQIGSGRLKSARQMNTPGRLKQPMNIWFIDTETSGLPGTREPATAANYRRWDTCRLVQLAWRHKKDAGSFTVRPDGYAIPEDAVRIHGISSAIAARDGIPLSDALDRIVAMAGAMTTIVAHNVAFDVNTLVAELYRAGRAADAAALAAMPTFCTMRAGTEPGAKYPTLCELHERYFGTPRAPLPVHQATVDVLMCQEIFHRMAARKAARQSPAPALSLDGLPASAPSPALASSPALAPSPALEFTPAPTPAPTPALAPSLFQTGTPCEPADPISVRLAAAIADLQLLIADSASDRMRSAIQESLEEISAGLCAADARLGRLEDALSGQMSRSDRP